MNSDGNAVPLEKPALVNSTGERRDRIIYKVVLTGGKLLSVFPAKQRKWVESVFSIITL